MLFLPLFVLSLHSSKLICLILDFIKGLGPQHLQLSSQFGPNNYFKMLKLNCSLDTKFLYTFWKSFVFSDDMVMKSGQRRNPLSSICFLTSQTSYMKQITWYKIANQTFARTPIDLINAFPTQKKMNVTQCY